MFMYEHFFCFVFITCSRLLNRGKYGFILDFLKLLATSPPFQVPLSFD